MRILVALIAVFMVSGAVAQKKPNTPSYNCTSAGTCTGFTCQLKSKGPLGPIYVCKDSKTGKTKKVECQLSGTNNGDIHAQKMPKQLSGTELQKMCYVPDGRNDGKVT